MVFSGPHNYLEVLEKYVDLDVLPPCIVPGGKGRVAIDMPPRFEGGLLPTSCQEDFVPVEEEELVDYVYRFEDNAKKEAGEEGGSITSLETSFDSDTEFLAARKRRGVKVQCQRIVGGSWSGFPQHAIQVEI